MKTEDLIRQAMRKPVGPVLRYSGYYVEMGPDMANYRHCTNLPTFSTEMIEASGGDTGTLVSCETIPYRFFDTIDSEFLRALGDYRIGDPLEPMPDPEGKIRVKNLAELQANYIVGCYTTLEAIMTPAARLLVGWTDKDLGQPWPGA